MNKDAMETDDSNVNNNKSKVVEVLISFKTTFDKYRVTEEPIAIPTRLKRFGLSDIVNHLLQLPKQVPFDFLLNDTLLRGSLLKGIQTQKLSTENVIELVYIPALLSPEVDATITSPDWIACLDSGIHGFVFSGSYDGSISIDTHSGKQVATLKAHTGPVKGISVAKTADNNNNLIVVSGSQDRILKTWKGEYNNAKKKVSSTLIQYAMGNGHTSEITDVAIGPSRDIVASTSWDHTVRMWKLPVSNDDGSSEPSLKKRKGKNNRNNKNLDEQKEMECLHVLKEHTGASVSLAWASQRSVYSGGMDRRIVSWDVENGQLNNSMNCTHAVTSLDYSPQSGIIASGHPDHCIRLWDPRTKSDSLVLKSLKSHKQWVSDVCWAPYNEFLLSSVSYDGTMTIWDSRALMPLHTVKDAHELKAKILCVDWKVEDTIVSGASDCKISVNKIKK